MADADPLSTDVAKLLTHVDASVREKTVQKICKYLKQREKSQKRIQDEEFQKLWKALYYCFWLTDKVPVQMEMGDMLAELSRSFSRDDNVHAFFTAFFFVLRREWVGVDYLRLDKFMALVRRMVNEWLLYLRTQDWNAKVLENFTEILRDQVLLPTQPDGLRMHVAFVYLPELIKVAGPQLAEETLRELLSPFLCILLAPPSEVMLNATIKDVFTVLESNQFDDINGNPVKFENLDKQKVGSAIFDMAATDESLTSGRRKALYTLAKRFNVTSRSAQAEQQVEVKPQKKETEASSNEKKTIKPHVKRTIEALFAGRTAAKSPKVQEEETKTNTPKQKKTKVEAPKQSEVHEKANAQAEESDGDSNDASDLNKSFDSVVTTASKKNVRFSHKDIMKIPVINKRMKEVETRPAAELGLPKKSLLKKTSSSDVTAPQAPTVAKGGKKKGKKL